MKEEIRKDAIAKEIRQLLTINESLSKIFDNHRARIVELERERREIEEREERINPHDIVPGARFHNSPTCDPCVVGKVGYARDGEKNALFSITGLHGHPFEWYANKPLSRTEMANWLNHQKFQRHPGTWVFQPEQPAQPTCDAAAQAPNYPGKH